jgi:hypothetical protein
VTDPQQIEMFWITTMPECNIFKIHALRFPNDHPDFLLNC